MFGKCKVRHSLHEPIIASERALGVWILSSQPKTERVVIHSLVLSMFCRISVPDPLGRSWMKCGVKLQPHSVYTISNIRHRHILAFLPTSSFQITMSEKRGNFVSPLHFASLHAAAPKLFYKLPPSPLGIFSGYCLKTSNCSSRSGQTYDFEHEVVYRRSRHAAPAVTGRAPLRMRDCDHPTARPGR